MKKLLIICALITSVSVTYAQNPGFDGGQARGGFGGGQGGQGRGGQGGAGAQARTPEARAQTYLETLMESFTLNKDQRALTLAILVAENKSLDSLNASLPAMQPPAQGAAMDPAAMQARQALMQALQPKRTAIMAASEAQFVNVLTDKQKKLYALSIKNRPEGQGFGQAGRANAGGQQGGGQRGGGGGFGGGGFGGPGGGGGGF